MHSPDHEPIALTSIALLRDEEVSYELELIGLIYIYIYIGMCEGCFCDGATWRAESDHDVDFGLEKRGSRTQNSTKGLKPDPRANGTLSKNI